MRKVDICVGQDADHWRKLRETLVDIHDCRVGPICAVRQKVRRQACALTRGFFDGGKHFPLPGWT